ncbi:MAG: hypothetical protein WCF44_21910 [Candidatus Methylophosphatis roskildensis]
MRPKFPKMLPWLAKSAGVPIARAEELWADAIRYATIETGWVETPEYWKVAVDRLLELLQTEASTCHPPRLTPWVTINMRMASLPMIAANGIALAWSAAIGQVNQRCFQTQAPARRAA